MPTFDIPSCNEEDSFAMEPNASAYMDDDEGHVEYNIVQNGTQRGKPNVVDSRG